MPTDTVCAMAPHQPTPPRATLSHEQPGFGQVRWCGVRNGCCLLVLALGMMAGEIIFKEGHVSVRECPTGSIGGERVKFGTCSAFTPASSSFDRFQTTVGVRGSTDFFHNYPNFPSREANKTKHPQIKEGVQLSSLAASLGAPTITTGMLWSTKASLPLASRGPRSRRS